MFDSDGWWFRDRSERGRIPGWLIALILHGLLALWRGHRWKEVQDIVDASTP